MADDETENVSLNIESGSYRESHLSRPPDYLVGFDSKVKHLLDNKKFCDVTLIAGTDGFKVEAHKLVLYASSPYFEALFSGPLRKTKDKVVTLPNIDGNSLNSIINYMYTYKITLTSSTVEAIIKAAYVFKLDSLVYLCTDFIAQHMDLSNCVDISSFAGNHKLQRLHTIGMEYIYQNFMQLRNRKEFFQLNLDQLCKCISSDNLCVPYEEDIFRSVMFWVNYDKKKREAYIDILLDHIRFPLLTPEFIANEVELVCKTGKSQNLLYNAMTWHSAPNIRAQLFPKSLSQLRKATKVLFAIIDWGTSKDKLRVGCYNPVTNIWTYSYWPCPKTCRSDFGYTAINDKLIIAGGALDTGESTKAVEILDLRSLQWTEAPSMTVERKLFGITTMDENIYVTGGANESDYVEEWNLSSSQWDVALCLQNSLGPDTRMVAGKDLLCISKRAQANFGTDPDRFDHSIYYPKTNIWNEGWMKTSGVLLGTGVWRNSSIDYFVLVTMDSGIILSNIREGLNKTVAVHTNIRPECTDIKLFGDRVFYYGTNVFHVYDLLLNKWIDIPEIENSKEKIILFSN